ncbi:MAG: hypothetical protein ACLGGX_12145 [Bdellovibrionia bacterium]
MSKNTPKLPKSGGAQRALDTIKKLRNQQPSDRLVKIISEYGNDVPAEKDNGSKKPPVAAKDLEI